MQYSGKQNTEKDTEMELKHEITDSHVKESNLKIQVTGLRE